MSHYPGYPLTHQENQSNYNFDQAMLLTPNHHLSKGMPLQQQPPLPHAMAQPQAYPGYAAQYQHQVSMMHHGYHQQPTQYMVAPPPMAAPSQLQQPPEIAQEWEKIKLARQKLELMEEKIQVDQELLKQEKRQRRRERQRATQELHSEWQREVKLLQERSLQIKEEYEAKLLAQKQESGAELETAKKAMGQLGDQENALQELKTEHANMIQTLHKTLEEEKQKAAQSEEQIKAKYELQLQALQTKLDAKDVQLQNDLKIRQQQWLDKLHAQEQKQQERVEDLKSSILKEYEVKVVQLQDQLEGKSSKMVETEFEQKLSKIQADHNGQMAKLQKELQERDNAIQELEKKDQAHQAAVSQIEELNRKLAKKDEIVEELTKSLEEANAQGVKELAQPSIVQELETQIQELRLLLQTRDVDFKSQTDTTMSLEAKLDEKEKMVSKLERDLLETAKGRDDQQQQVEMFTSLKETLVEREAAIEKLTSRVQDLEVRNEAFERLQSTLTEREETIKALEAEIPNLKREHNQRFAALQDRLIDLERILSDKDETIYYLEEQLSERDQEQGMALHERETNFQETLLASESTIKALESQVQYLEEQLEEAKRLYDTEAKEHLLAAKDITIQEMEQQIADLKQERDDLIIADMDAAMLNTRLKEKEAAVNRLELQLMELEQRQSSANQDVLLAEKDEALSRLEGQLLELERELEKKKMCHTCQTLREELTETQGKYRGLQAEQVIASSTAEDYLKLRKEMSQLLRKDEQLKERIRALEQEVQTMKKINETLKEEMGEDGSNPCSNISRLRALQRLQFQQNRKQVMEIPWRGSSTVDAGIYTGFVNNLGNPDGAGTLKFEDGSVYDGEFKDGNLHGEGVFAWVDGDTYRGEWFEGRQHGYGVFVWADGRLYQGNYVHGQRDGEGLMTWPYGARYKGMYRRDKRNGYGVYTYPDGRVYKGEYKDERPHGVGTETAPDGNIIYTGEWVMGEFQNDSTESI